MIWDKALILQHGIKEWNEIFRKQGGYIQLPYIFIALLYEQTLDVITSIQEINGSI